jgi:hypothetical protein
MLDLYLDAEVAVLAGKEVRFNDGAVDRTLRSEDLEWIQKGRREWQAKVNELARTSRGAPHFGGLGFSVARLD